MEGKSDYYILRYALQVLKRDEIALILGTGAGTFEALASLHVGWNLNFVFILDSDRQGINERKRYIADLGLSEENAKVLSDFTANAEGIESIPDDADYEKIQSKLGLNKKPPKSQISRYFQEKLAANQIETMSPNFMKMSEAILTGINKQLEGE